MTLDDYRKAEGVTLKQLAKRLEMSSTGHVSDLVTRRRDMPVKIAQRFSVLINRPWPEVFEANRRCPKAGNGAVSPHQGKEAA